MRRIFVSLLLVVLIGSAVAYQTIAVFSSKATVGMNTFSTGIFEIRVNGQPSIQGFTATNMAPGQCISGQFNVNNYGQPWFAGPSTLNAYELVLSSQYGSQGYASPDIWEVLTIKVEANRGWSTWMPVYEGKVMDMFEADLLSPRWSELATGNSEDVRYEVCLPIDAGDDYQGQTASFNFVVDEYNPVRPNN